MVLNYVIVCLQHPIIEDTIWYNQIYIEYEYDITKIPLYIYSDYN